MQSGQVVTRYFVFSNNYFANDFENSAEQQIKCSIASKNKRFLFIHIWSF